MKRLIAAFSMALVLGACATASKPGAMVPELTEATIIAEDSKLAEAVSVEGVDGGQKTNPLWVSKVSNEDFTEALRQALAAHAMLATDAGKYSLAAELVKLKQPVMGFDMSVTSDVKYTLTEIETGEVVFEDTVSEKYTAKMSDAFVGVERLRLANEGSIKSNISSLIAGMIAAVDGAEETGADAEPEAVGTDEEAEGAEEMDVASLN